MQDQKKVYGGSRFIKASDYLLNGCLDALFPSRIGFTISLYEYAATIPTLWDEVRNFLAENPGLTPEDNAMNFISDDGGETYNKCHCE